MGGFYLKLLFHKMLITNYKFKNQFLKIISNLFALMMNAIDLLMRPLQKMIGVRRMPYIFLLPNLIFFGLFVIVPLVVNIFFSVTGGTELYISNREFSGLRHYQTLFDCQDYFNPNSCNEDYFWRGIYNTITFVFFQVILMIFFSLLTGVVLNKNIIGRGFFRSVFFFPVLLSPVVVGLIWKWILLKNGILNAIIESNGGTAISFLTDPGLAMSSSIFVSIWAHMGFYTLIILAGLQAIPPNLYEAAEMDGTSKERTFWRITIPLLLPNLLVVFVLASIKGVQTFDEIYVLTGGGPGTATSLIVQYIYTTGFAAAGSIQNFGLAAAASMVLGLVLLVLTLIQLYLGRDKESKTQEI
jgi:alpha-1,4-digalacturonate transport system permease protein